MAPERLPSPSGAPRALKCAGFVALGLGALIFAWTRIPTSAWYRDGRPTRFGKLTNRAMGRYAALGIPSFRMVTLEVPGRKSGKPTSTVLVLTQHEGAGYLVSMLGERVHWVENVRAASGNAVIRHGKARAVHLEEVPVAQRATILHTYVQVAPGGRRHFPFGVDASVEEFEPLAAHYPVFKISTA